MHDETSSAPIPVAARPAAAVIALRDRHRRLEVLVGQRTAAARFMGGFWVFPGGRVDPGDGTAEAGFRRAAARELQEEVGLTVDAERLLPFDRWLTPEPLPHRFDTVFFLARVEPDAVETIDGEEIVASRWAAPAALLDEAAAGGMLLSFPTLRQLEQLAEWPTASAAIAACAERPFPAPVAPLSGDGILPRLRP